MLVRIVEADPRIDAVRGCLALERGPLVYCVEGADLPPGTELEEVELAVRSGDAPARPVVRWDRVRAGAGRPARAEWGSVVSSPEAAAQSSSGR
ncbi:MAG TPA: hypothetical protein VNJ28_00110 [Candidatus Limnocylindrales bacterium]|nr:hypothetical protein [Candidatus Limnocylindrales bacterium]